MTEAENEVVTPPAEDIPPPEEKTDAKQDGGKKEKKKLQKELDAAWAELKATKARLDTLSGERDELNSKYLRMLAEFDNFKKRTAKENEAVYSSAYIDVVKQLLPVFDNIERAVEFAADETSRNGLIMIVNSFLETLDKLGVTQYGAPGETFDAELHSAVMHIEDEEAGENTIAEVFQKGYRKGDRVIRYAMVKVAN